MVIVPDRAKLTNISVQVFEINAYGYYIRHQKEIDTSINLDGLIASEEHVVQLESVSPFQVVSKTFEFPSINHRGVFVVELIGNGKSSRALIRKGGLHYVDSLTPEGQLLHILNENYEPERNASVWISGTSYTANDKGEVILPFAGPEKAGAKQIILSNANKDVATFSNIQRTEEKYSLTAGVALDRESLLPSVKCSVIVQPKLFLCNSKSLALSKLSSLSCTISTTVLGNNKEVVATCAELDVTEGMANFTVPFMVPSLLQSVKIDVTAKLSDQTDKEISLSVQKLYSVNQNRTSTALIDCFLRAKDGKYVLLFLGKNGEPQKRIRARVYLNHAHFKNNVHFTLDSDKKGKIQLGSLNNISKVQVNADGVSLTKSWDIPTATRVAIPNTIHSFADESIQIPFDFDASSKPVAQLVRVINSVVVEDASAVLQVYNNQLKILPKVLTPGSYLLRWKQELPTVSIRIFDRAARVVGEWIVEDSKFYQYKPSACKPLAITSVRPSKVRPSLKVQLQNQTPSTRVHVVCSRLLPAFTQYDQLYTVTPFSPGMISTSSPTCYYTSGRELSDEYRYIIDRKYIQQYPHLMIDRPTLLSAPYAKSEVKNSQGFAAAGTEFDSVGKKDVRSGKAANMNRVDSSSYRDPSCIDFFAGASVVSGTDSR